MANVDVDAVLTRAREILEGDALGHRIPSAGSYIGGLPPGVTDAEASRRGLVAPRYDVRVTALEPHPSRPPAMHTLGIYTIEISVAIVRHVYLEAALISEDRDQSYTGLALNDGDVIRQALEFPFNMTQTNAAAQTGLVGGCLTYASSELVRYEMPGSGPGLIESSHAFTGVLTVDRA